MSACSSSSANVNMLALGDKAPFVLRGVTNVVQVSQLTGPTSPNKTGKYEVAGQDLGSMFRADGKTWFVFGDTFGHRAAGMTGGGGTGWRSHTPPYSTHTKPAHRLN